MSETTEKTGAAATTAEERNARRTLEGIVKSTKMQKTIVVESNYLQKHPKYGKYLKKYTKYYAHDEKNEAKEGDLVEITSTRPLSKLKRFRLVRIVRKAEQV